MDARGIIIWAIFIAVCATIIIVSRRIRTQTDQSGIEVDGVISRISETVGLMEGEGVSYDFYVKYRTLDGEEVEGLLTNPTPDLEEGQQVRIKYHPKYKLNARLV